MKPKTAIPSVVEKFRKQRQRMKKLLFAFVIVLVIGAAVPFTFSAFSIPQASSIGKTMTTIWGCFLGITLFVLAFAALFNQMCPACGKPVGEEFWMIRYCPHCGTKLRED